MISFSILQGLEQTIASGEGRLIAVESVLIGLGELEFAKRMAHA